MSLRAVKQILETKPTIEGAGVKLQRAFGFGNTSDFDPFLLLDDFRNDIPQDYLAGFPWHPHRPALFIESTHPVHFGERLPHQELPGVTIQRVHQSIAIGPQHDLHVGAVPIHVDQDRHLHRVVVVGVIGGELEVPAQFAGVGIERDDRVGVEIVARPLLVVPVR